MTRSPLTLPCVAGVHQGLAEQAFRNQAQALLADGVLTAEKSESLTKMREQMGLPQEAANKIIKGIQNQRLIGTAASLLPLHAPNTVPCITQLPLNIDLWLWRITSPFQLLAPFS